MANHEIAFQTICTRVEGHVGRTAWQMLGAPIQRALIAEEILTVVAAQDTDEIKPERIVLMADNLRALLQAKFS